MKLPEYEIMYRVEDRHWWYEGLRGIIQDSWSRYAPEGEVRLLDAGCGTGATLAMLSGHAHALGVDRSPEAVHFCRRRGQARTAVASVSDLPLGDCAIEVLLSCDVLCHESIEDTRAVLREMRRVLKPGGLLLLNLPAYQWLLSSHDTAVRDNHRFVRSELRALLLACAFEPIHITYWNAFLFVPMAAIRLWRRLRPLDTSDLGVDTAGTLSPVFAAVLALERRLIRAFPLPFGLSLFVVARKRD